MKKLILALFILTLSIPVFAADTNVNGYIKKNGTYVQPHVKTKPNKTKLNNYSTKGNINPYTGKKGTVDPFKIEDK